MIYDVIENAEKYFHGKDKFYRAIKYAVEFDLCQPDGEYEVDGRAIFAKVQGYDTSPAEERKFESHERYADVQVLRQGSERQDVSLDKELEPLTPYDEVKDVIKLKAPKEFSSLVMEPGKFVVFFPQDIHRPNCNLNGKCKVRKICMKVRL
jgi:YhcH/YjgK/YiaL family protein